MIHRQHTALIVGERIIYTIRRSRRAKRMLLKVTGDGAVEVVVPWRGTVGAVEDLVHRKQGWLNHHLRKMRSAPRRLEDGSRKEALARRYHHQARIFFTREAKALAKQLGVHVTRVVVGNQRTQWGSCSPAGRLSFNWRLLLGPRWVAQYVVAHEVAHLVRHNHSPQYWAMVEKIYPEYQQARRWLRRNAAQLQW